MADAATTVCLPRFDMTNPRAVAFARQQGSLLIREIDADTRAAVRQIIGDALEQGIPPRRAARAIRDQVGLTARQAKAVSNYRARLQASGLSAAKVDVRVAKYAEKVRRRRALTIARTETMRAANAGAKELWHQARDAGTLPGDIKRVWIATPDERVRPEHLAAHGQVVGLDEPFSVADGATEPGSVPNCRCTHGIATPEDLAAWEQRKDEARAEEAKPSSEALLAASPISTDEVLPGGSLNPVHRVEIEGGLVGYWKPDIPPGSDLLVEGMLEAAGGTLADRELLVRQVDQALTGGRLVPVTTRRSLLTTLPGEAKERLVSGTIQEQAAGEVWAMATNRASVSREDKIALTMLDVVVGNLDRQQLNAIVSQEGRLFAIDNGLTFMTGSGGSAADVLHRIVDWESIGPLTAREQAEWLSRLDDPKLLSLIESASFLTVDAQRSAARRIAALRSAVEENTVSEFVAWARAQRGG